MIIFFTRQIYILIKAGIPLLKALEIICVQLPQGKFKRDIELIIQDVREGKSFSESLGHYPKFFSLFYINLIKAAEVSGNLAGILKELSQNLFQQRRITRQVQAALMYPILVLTIAILILAVLLVFVIPVFTRIFEELGGSLPPATLFLIGLSKFTARWGWVFLLFGVTFGIAITFIYRKSERASEIIKAGVWRLPMFGPIIKTMEIGRLCRTLGSMLSQGVTLIKCLDVLIETTQGVLLRNAIKNIRIKLEQGDALSAVMEQAKVFPLTLVKMIQVGEETGKIGELFQDAADDYEDEVSFALNGLLSLLEPLLILIMGGIVGFIVVALFFPIFTISSLVQ
ncbi:MAG: type II secretion system F family protein [Candidatus Omnitrophota bacterium]